LRRATQEIYHLADEREKRKEKHHQRIKDFSNELPLFLLVVFLTLVLTVKVEHP